jgi:hypothetical protein
MRQPVTSRLYCPVMTTRSASRPDTVGGPDELQQLRARIKELENELQSARTGARSPRLDRDSGGLKIVLAAALAVTTLFSVWQVILTFRRWVGWLDD